MTDHAGTAIWAHKELSGLLGFDIGAEYAHSIVRIETEPEIREFVGSLLDLAQPANRAFLDALLVRLNKVPAGVTVYRKPDLDDHENKGRRGAAAAKSKEAAEKATVKSPPVSSQASTSAGGKSTTVRTPCECQATTHKLVANCLGCGRIVCEKEGSGPCYFCSSLVCTPDELEKIKRGSNKGEKLRAELLARGWPTEAALARGLDRLTLAPPGGAAVDAAALQRAVEHKNKLIDFDRSSAKRTQVIDDESDYFSTNSKWVTPKQRALLQQKEAELRERRFGSRLAQNAFTLDFAGRRVVNERGVDFKRFEEEAERIQTGDKDDEETRGDAGDRDVEARARKLQFIEENKINKKPVRSTTTTAAKEKPARKLRIQDGSLQELKDEGMCLSMHQPWASLLVAGIKIHEGRSWYTPYRGRLWIHAGAKEPSQDEIREQETFHRVRNMNEAESIQFPENYPTSCLLGYVDLTDCLAAETYRAEFPQGESESEYVFICTNPNELLVKVPMPGQHKIFKLDPAIHASAKKIPTY